MAMITDTISESSKKVIGPVLFDFVCWTLQEACKRNIQRLYFLARDGYLLHKIALKISETQGLPIECRYLYCSRTALRLPSYHLIGDEAYDLLLLGGYHLSRHNILDRIYIDLEERNQIYKELGYLTDGENDWLSYEEFFTFTKKLKNNNLYRNLVIQKSKAAYPSAIGYLKQEGLLDINHIAIVDSGWTGTMQRSLRQLVSSAGYLGNITGFYFGIYHIYKREAVDGEYYSWYFNKNSSALNKLMFSNSLFECFLSAPHGMTLSYECSSGFYKPILNLAPSKRMLFLIDTQIQAVLHCAEDKLNTFKLLDFDSKAAKRNSELLLRRLMVRPSQAEAEAYGSFAFCDDISENNLLPLASRDQEIVLKQNYLICTRMFRKVSGLSKTFAKNDLFWPYGTVALTMSRGRAKWYRLNIFLWDLIRWRLSKRQS